METPDKVDQREEETNYDNSNNTFYSPCYCVQQVFKAFCKCLGLERDDNVPPSGPSDEPETQIKFTRGEYTSASVTRATRRPPRPDLSSGKGGQTN